MGEEESKNAVASEKTVHRNKQRLLVQGGFDQYVSNNSTQSLNTDEHNNWSTCNWKGDSVTQPSTLDARRHIQSQVCTGSESASETTSLLQGQTIKRPQKNCCITLVVLMKHLWWMTSELIREEIVVLLSALFITLFGFLTLEVSTVVVGRML